MNIILYFTILCVGAVHVRSMRKEAPSRNDFLFFNGLMQKPQYFETKNEINVLPEVPLVADNEIDVSELFNNPFTQKEKRMNVVPKSPEISDEEFDVSELFRDLISAPDEQLVNQHTTTPSQTEEKLYVSEMLHDQFPQKEQKMKNLPRAISKSDEEIEFSKLLNDLFPETEQKVNVLPASKSKSEIYVSESFRDFIPGPDVPRVSSKLDMSKFLEDFFSPQNEEVVEMVPMAPPKIEKKLHIPDLFMEIIPISKERKEPVEVKIEEKIISTVPQNDLAADEKKEISLKPNLTTKITELLSDIVSPLEQRLLDEFERALVPLNDIIELGANIKNSPFTEEEIKKFGLFTIYMETTQELYSEFKSQVHSFGVNRFYETAVHTHYHLSEKQKNHAINVLKDTAEKVKAESNAIYDLILKPENQQLIKSIENKKLELSASLRAITLALKANYAHLIDDDKMEDVKTKRLLIIEENSKSMIELLQSTALASLKDGIIEHVDKLIDIMNKLPMKITLSYMF